MEEHHLDNLLQGMRQGVSRPQEIRVRNMRDEVVKETQDCQLTSTNRGLSLLIKGDFLARICWAGSSAVECLPRTQERAPTRPLPEAGGSSPPQSTKNLFRRNAASC